MNTNAGAVLCQQRHPLSSALRRSVPQNYVTLFFFFFVSLIVENRNPKLDPVAPLPPFPPPFIIRIISHLKSKRDQKEVRQIKRVEKEIGAREKAKVKMLLGQLTSGQKNAPGSSLLFQLRTHSADVSFKRINSFFYLVVAYGSVFVETFLYSLV